MNGNFIIEKSGSFLEHNIYADKSSVVLSWILNEGINKKTISIREIVQETKISIGLVQRIFSVLVNDGILQTEGVRTSKKFFLKEPKRLLDNWLNHYQLVKNCKIWTYRSGIKNKGDMLDLLKKANLCQSLPLALHSAAEIYGYKNTNLQTLELYLSDLSLQKKIEKILYLEPQERGYEILLIKPYYKSLLREKIELIDDLWVSSPLLTFLDLYNYPLRGQEQAMFLGERDPGLKRIFKAKK
ncbi:type IV toxin-antitoxin system AbiEi family antitoxin [Chlamydiales bacterium]|nr:type IV toxin-antitoxin system AbiEi family antitoxin [Chlamydiales bacterium]